jgi:hypothetical protein
LKCRFIICDTRWMNDEISWKKKIEILVQLHIHFLYEPDKEKEKLLNIFDSLCEITSDHLHAKLVCQPYISTELNCDNHIWHVFSLIGIKPNSMIDVFDRLSLVLWNTNRTDTSALCHNHPSSVVDVLINTSLLWYWSLKPSHESLLTISSIYMLSKASDTSYSTDTICK